MNLTADQTEQRRTELNALIAMQNERNYRYAMLMHHAHNLGIGTRGCASPLALERLAASIGEERAEYDAYVATVDAAKRRFREVWDDR